MSSQSWRQCRFVQAYLRWLTGMRNCGDCRMKSRRRVSEVRMGCSGSVGRGPGPLRATRDRTPPNAPRDSWRCESIGSEHRRCLANEPTFVGIEHGMRDDAYGPLSGRLGLERLASPRFRDQVRSKRGIGLASPHLPWCCLASSCAVDPPESLFIRINTLPRLDHRRPKLHFLSRAPGLHIDQALAEVPTRSSRRR